MGWLSVLVCATPVFLLWGRSHTALLALAVINAALNLWSFGTMHNHAVEGSRRRIVQLRQNLLDEGRSQDEVAAVLARVPLRSDPDAAPNWLASLNVVSAVGGVAFLVTAFVVR